MRRERNPAERVPRKFASAGAREGGFQPPKPQLLRKCGSPPEGIWANVKD
jgi:hypothetical protein